METKPQRRTPVVLLKSRTTDGKSAGSKSIIMIIEKNAQMHRKWKACRYVRNARKAYEDCQDKLKKATVKSYQTIMLTSPTGGAAARALGLSD